MFKSLLAVALAALVQAQSSDFAMSCPQYQLQSDGHTLYAACYADGSGTRAYTSTLDLNTCFANNHGYIVYQRNGNFAYSCYDEALNENDATFTATCNNGQGGVGHDTINLDYYVGNQGGYLVC